MEHQPTSSNMFQGASPKLTFLFGVVTGVVVAAVLGGFIIVPKLYGASQSGTSVSTTTGTTGSAPTAAAPSAAGQAAPAGNVKAISKDDHIRGAKSPKLYLVEYSDMECPFCKSFHPSMQQALQEYSDKIAWVYRHFPLSFHANAPKEAEASECANELGGNDAFWKYTDKIFERTTSNGTGFALDALAPLAKEIGLNEGKFKSCLDSGKYAAHVSQDMAGGTAAGVNGTPSTFLVSTDGKTITNISGAQPYPQIKTVIDQALK